mgnify:CR=1 FL=1
MTTYKAAVISRRMPYYIQIWNVRHGQWDTIAWFAKFDNACAEYDNWNNINVLYNKVRVRLYDNLCNKIVKYNYHVANVAKLRALAARYHL